MAAELWFLGFPTAFTSAGMVATGAKAYFYLPGTLTLTTVYSDSGLTIPRANPVVANAAGRFPDTYLDEALTYRVRITDALGVLLDETDPYTPGSIWISASFGTATGMTNVTTRSLLAQVPAALGAAYLSEAGRQGTFKWNAANLSAQVTADPYQGIYVAPSTDTDGSSGAWVREYGPGEPWHAEWFGMPTASNDSPVMRSLEALRPSGTHVHFGPGTFIWSDVEVTKPGHWIGAGKLTAMQHGGTDRAGGTSIYTTLGQPDTNASGFIFKTTGGTRVSNMRFTNLKDQDNSGASFPILVVGVPVWATTAGEMLDFEFDHLWFDGCDTGIRALYAGYPLAAPVWYTPERIHIHDCVFDDVRYEAVVPEGREIVIERCKFYLATALTRPQSYSIRALGCHRVTIRNNHFDAPRDTAIVSFQFAGNGGDLSNVGFRSASEVLFESNRCNGGVIQVQHMSRHMIIRGNTFWSDPALTTNPTVPTIYCAGQSTPVYFGKLEVTDNYFVGNPKPLYLENFSAQHVAFSRNTIAGNETTGGVNDVFPIHLKVQNGTTYQDGVTQVKPPILFEVEDNDIFVNPTQVGSVMVLDGNLTGLFFSYTGNKVTERDYGSAQIGHTNASGTTPQVRVSKTTAFAAFSGLGGLAADVVGDNLAMPNGFYDSLMAASFYRAEQTVAAYPPVFA